MCSSGVWGCAHAYNRPHSNPTGSTKIERAGTLRALLAYVLIQGLEVHMPSTTLIQIPWALPTLMIKSLKQQRFGLLFYSAKDRSETLGFGEILLLDGDGVTVLPQT